MLLSTHANADSIRLHDQAGSSAANITLVQIAELEGEYAHSLGDTVVGRFGETQTELSIQLATVRRVLTEAHVNWSDLSLRGRSVCVVTRLRAKQPPPTETTAAPPPTPPAEPARDHVSAPNYEFAVRDPDAGRTLSDRLIDRLVEFVGADPDALEITFQGGPDAAAWLNRSLAVGHFEIDPRTSSGLGRVPIQVRHRTPSGETQQTVVTARVVHHLEALVAVAPVRRGDLFTERNVALRPVRLTSQPGPTLADLGLVIGQTAAAGLREGELVLTDHIAPDVLIRRGDLVTVECVSGALSVNYVGRATGDGVLGDIVAVRTAQTRETIYATVTGERQARIDMQKQSLENLASSGDRR
ncbi:MAG: flagellar basal body P-ring formation chaperone FlgA [Planctomycetota bacterium]